MDVSTIAAGATLAPNGLWVAPSDAVISYPDEGSAFCYGVEDQSFWFAHRNRVLVALVRRYRPAAGPLLDVGGGNGFVAAALTAAGFDTIVIEPSAEGARHARYRGLPHVVHGTLAGARIRTGRAGGAGLFDVLEHVADERSLLEEVYRCLAPAGRVYVTVPSYQALWSIEDAVGGHCRRYTRRTLARALESAGFVVEFTSYCFWWLPLPIALFRAVPYRLGYARRTAPSPTEHTLGSAVLRSIAALSFSPEPAAVRSGMPIPLGASCVAVGLKRPGRS